jgi:hypothetical protein
LQAWRKLHSEVNLQHKEYNSGTQEGAVVPVRKLLEVAKSWIGPPSSLAA